MGNIAYGGFERRKDYISALILLYNTTKVSCEENLRWQRKTHLSLYTLENSDG